MYSKKGGICQAFVIFKSFQDSINICNCAVIRNAVCMTVKNQWNGMVECNFCNSYRGLVVIGASSLWLLIPSEAIHQRILLYNKLVIAQVISS